MVIVITTATIRQSHCCNRLSLVIAEGRGVKLLVQLREQARLYWLYRVTWPFLSTETSIVSVIHLGKVAIPLCVPTLIEVARTLLLHCQRRIVVCELYSGRVHRWLASVAMIRWFTEQLGLHLQAGVP